MNKTPFNTIYPNIPDTFIDTVYNTMKQKGLSQGEVARATGITTQKLGQFFNRRRNMPRDVAVKLRDFFDLDIFLPPVDEALSKELRRLVKSQMKRPNKIRVDEPFMVEIDGEYIQVLTWRPMFGEIKNGTRV